MIYNIWYMIWNIILYNIYLHVCIYIYICIYIEIWILGLGWMAVANILCTYGGFLKWGIPKTNQSWPVCMEKSMVWGCLIFGITHMPVVRNLNFFKLQDIEWIMNYDSLANIRNDWLKKGNEPRSSSFHVMPGWWSLLNHYWLFMW